MSDPSYLYPANGMKVYLETQIERWRAEKPVHSLKKGDFICMPGQSSDSVYFMLEGHARIFHIHMEGKECVLGIRSEGDFIDLLQIFTDRESQLFARALTDVKVIAVNKSEIKQEIQKNEELLMSLLYYFSSRLQETIEILEQIAYGKVEERLLFLLNKLANKSDTAQEWHPLPEYLTHSNLAGMIASTRETVTFLLNKLVQTGQVRQEDQRIWIKEDL